MLARKARHGTPRAPGMRSALDTGVAADRIGRPQTFAELRVDKVDDIGTQRHIEHLGPRKLRNLGSCGAEDLDSRVHPSTIFWPTEADNINLASGVPKKGPRCARQSSAHTLLTSVSAVYAAITTLSTESMVCSSAAAVSRRMLARLAS